MLAFEGLVTEDSPRPLILLFLDWFLVIAMTSGCHGCVLEIFLGVVKEAAFQVLEMVRAEELSVDIEIAETCVGGYGGVLVAVCLICSVERSCGTFWDFCDERGCCCGCGKGSFKRAESMEVML